MATQSESSEQTEAMRAVGGEPFEPVTPPKETTASNRRSLTPATPAATR
ncbi:hypothetical protein [Pseudophaeobacter arcticus]|nr:hypothetical protein [Pseudophaeobacter arcticus]